MSRYIDADAYAAEMKTRQDACKGTMDAAKEDDNWELYANMSAKFSIFVEAKLTLDAMPTVDAVPVVHGEWVEKWRFKPNGNPYHKVGDMECSVCHSDMLGRYYSRYCPHCGAKMEGERR